LLRWHSIIGADLTTEYTIYPEDLDLDETESYLVFNFANPQGTIAVLNSNDPLIVPAAPLSPTNEYVQIQTSLPSAAPQPGRVNVSQNEPHLVHYNYYIVAPLTQWTRPGASNGFALLGELDKFVPVSAQRFTSLKVDPYVEEKRLY